MLGSRSMHASEMALRALLLSAQQLLLRANERRRDRHAWPRGLSWSELDDTSRRTLLWQACEQAGVPYLQLTSILDQVPVDLSSLWRHGIALDDASSASGAGLPASGQPILDHSPT